jgi:hypothetical protein
VQPVNPFNEQTPGEYFVGREDELETFGRVLSGVLGGQANHAFVAGVHGTGKTSILAEVQRLADAAGLIGVSTGLDDKAPPVDAIRKILRSVVVRVQDCASATGRGPALVDDWDRGARSTLFQQTKTPYPSSDAVLEDLRRLLGVANEAGAPGIVTCLDEGQRMPGSALSALKNALQQEPGILVVLSLRLATATDGPRKAGRALLDQIANEAEGDIGASRLFVTEIGMGPFATFEEAQRCITRRLRDNPIAFDASVVRAIAQLSDRVPRDVIRYSHKVWERAATTTSKRADDVAFNRVVEDLHAAEVDRAHLLVANLSALKRRVLETLLDCGGRGTSHDVAQRLQPAGAGDLDVLTRAVLAELNDVVAIFPGVAHHEGVFQVPRPEDLFALRLALEDR